MWANRGPDWTKRGTYWANRGVANEQGRAPQQQQLFSPYIPFARLFLVYLRGPSVAI